MDKLGGELMITNNMITRRVMMNDKLQDKDGTQITCENCKGSKFSGLKIYGKSKQVTTTGAQLFPPPMLGSQEKNGITIDCMEDGKIRISGTAEITTDFYVSRMQLSAGTYTSSGGVNIDASVLRYALVDDIGVPYFDVDGDYTTDTIKEPIEAELLLRVYAGKTIDLIVQPMLNAGSTPLPWETYTGGKPSPSPDYPQEIESVGQGKTIGINVRGKNLLRIDNSLENYESEEYAGTANRIISSGMVAIGLDNANLFVPQYISNCVMDNGSISYHTKSPGFAVGIGAQLTSGQTYTCSFDSTNNGRLCLLYYDTNGTCLKKQDFVKSTFTVPENVVYTVLLFRDADKAGDYKFWDIRLESGDTATPYEPYHEAQSMDISTPNGLPGIPVSSGGNYTDVDGRQWICDEVDFARGMYVQRITKKLLTSTGKYALSSTVISNKFRILINDISANTVLPVKTPDKIGAVMADFLFAKSANETYECREGISVEITGNITFYVETIQTVEQAQEYFKDNPMTLYYALAAPIETPLTSDQLAAYKQLHTYADSTAIISNDANAYMGVTYRRLRD